MSTSTSDLASQVNQPPPAGWRPKPGDTISGIVIGVTRSGEGQFGAYPIVTIRKDDGSDVAVHAFHTVLQRELVKLRPVVGETIAIAYLGDQKDKDGKVVKKPGQDPAQIYRVACGRENEGTQVWDEFGQGE